MNFTTAQKGHAHVYVDGKKIGRVYGPNVHLGDLTAGEHEIRVTLNANTHDDYLLDGEMVEAVTTVNVTKGVEAKDDTVTWTTTMTVMTMIG